MNLYSESMSAKRLTYSTRVKAAKPGNGRGAAGGRGGGGGPEEEGRLRPPQTGGGGGAGLLPAAGRGLPLGRSSAG